MSQVFLQSPFSIVRDLKPKKLVLEHDVYNDVVINDDGTCSEKRVSISESLAKYKCSDFRISALKAAGVPLNPVVLSPSDDDIRRAMDYAGDLSDEFANDSSKFIEPKNV